MMICYLLLLPYQNDSFYEYVNLVDFLILTPFYSEVSYFSLKNIPVPALVALCLYIKLLQTAN